jgi:small subunit ribosomal protein S20
MRQNEKRRLRNRAVKQRIRKLVKQYLAVVSQGDKEAAQKAFSEVVSALDKAVKYGVLHWATADRKKSRLAHRLNALLQSQAPKQTSN